MPENIVNNVRYLGDFAPRIGDEVTSLPFLTECRHNIVVGWDRCPYCVETGDYLTRVDMIAKILEGMRA